MVKETDSLYSRIRKELSRRRKSKKARKRLLRSLNKRKHSYGSFSLDVHLWRIQNIIMNFTRHFLNRPSIGRELFTITPIGEEHESSDK